MDKYNIFLCYRGEQAGLLARSIYLEIKSCKNNKLKVFYAPECINYGEDFVERCKKVASSVSLMVTFITKDFFSKITQPDDVVALEVRNALDNPNCTFLPIIFKDFDFKAATQEIESVYTADEIKRITHVNAINYTDVYTFDSFSLLGAIFEYFSLKKDEIDEDAAQKRMNVDDEQLSAWVANNAEKRRQQIQTQLLLKYDLPIYERLLEGGKDLVALDVGCGNGSTIMTRIGSRPEVAKIVGIDRSKNLVDAANARYGNAKAKFYQLDVESEDFEERLEGIMEENGIGAFDLVNVGKDIGEVAGLGKIDVPVSDPSELAKVLKAAKDDMAVLVKMNMRDCCRHGMELDESLEVAKTLENLGAHCLVLSSGFVSSAPMDVMRGAMPFRTMAYYMNQKLMPLLVRSFGSNLVPPVKFKEAYFLEDALKFRQALKMPLCYVGGLVSKDKIDEVLGDGFDFVAMARALLNNPHFVNDMREDEHARVSCDHSNYCIGRMYSREMACHKCILREGKENIPQSLLDEIENNREKGY